MPHTPGLKQLYLRNNRGLSGPLPASISQLTNLTRLNIGATALDGRVPSFLG